MSQSANRSAFLKRTALVALLIWALALIDTGIMVAFVFQLPLIIVPQYIAAGVLGEVAYTGGLASAALGLVIHYFNAFVISA